MSYSLACRCSVGLPGPYAQGGGMAGGEGEEKEWGEGEGNQPAKRQRKVQVKGQKKRQEEEQEFSLFQLLRWLDVDSSGLVRSPRSAKAAGLPYYTTFGR